MKQATKTPSDGRRVSDVGNEFAPGSHVMLRSGGAGMTVIDVGKHSGQVWCRWMGADGTVKDERFPADALQADPRRPIR
jgi:uncharacterized protein YodC (DUF2158 family)